MGHDHHHHSSGNYGRAFAIGIGLNLAFVIIEAVYGRISNSMALVADAGHNLSDVLGLALAWGGTVLARRGPTEQRTYGLRRTSILAALVNASILLIAVGAIAWECLSRLQNPGPVTESTVIWVAGIGILINGGTALLFMSGTHDLNIRGAFNHLASDAAISLGVVIAGVAIVFTGWLWLDPAVSLIIVLFITYSTWGLLRDSLNLVLDKVPPGINVGDVREYLSQLPTCTDVHDLHIWGMSTTETALTAHVVLEQAVCDDALLATTARELHDRFGIEHTTLQVELGDPTYPCSCRLA